MVAGLTAAQGARLVTGAILWQTARSSRSSGDPERSRRSLEWAARIIPEIGTLRSSHAQSLAGARKPSRALAELDAARRLWFSFQDLFLYGRLLREARGRTPAIAYWRHLAQALPPLVRPHFELGRLYEEGGDREAAIREYRAVIASTQPTGAAEALRRVARKRLAALAGQ